jgi:hypothetical protein
MLATLGGTLALVLGLAVLLLPLLVNELSRPRDAVWGGVVLLLGLVLVTSSERLTGSPMLAVLCGGLLIGRLGSEVGLARWRQLSDEERQRLGSMERWRTGLRQLGASVAVLAERAVAIPAILGGLVARWRAPRGKGRRWVRPEPVEDPVEPVEEPVEPVKEPEAAQVVSGFAEIDALIAAADPPDADAQAPAMAPPPEAG